MLITQVRTPTHSLSSYLLLCKFSYTRRITANTAITTATTTTNTATATATATATTISITTPTATTTLTLYTLLTLIDT